MMMMMMTIIRQNVISVLPGLPECGVQLQREGDGSGVHGDVI